MGGTAAAPRLGDEQLVELLDVMREVDSVELKLTVPEMNQRSAIRALQIDPLNAQIRQVFFFETPDLALDKKGVVVRARRIQGKGNDSVVKLRPVVPHELPERLRTSASFVVEVDAMPGGYVCSGSLKGKLPSTAVHEVATGTTRLRKLFSREQRAFFEANAPDGLALDDLAILGPIFVLKVNFTPEEFARRMVGELWLYPDGSRILELSTKCAPTEAFQVAAEARAFLAGRGIHLAGEQQTKTKTALEFFSRELQAGDAA